MSRQGSDGMAWHGVRRVVTWPGARNKISIARCWVRVQVFSWAAGFLLAWAIDGDGHGRHGERHVHRQAAQREGLHDQASQALRKLRGSCHARGCRAGCDTYKVMTDHSPHIAQPDSLLDEPSGHVLFQLRHARAQLQMLVPHQGAQADTCQAQKPAPWIPTCLHVRIAGVMMQLPHYP